MQTRSRSGSKSPPKPKDVKEQEEIALLRQENAALKRELKQALDKMSTSSLSRSLETTLASRSIAIKLNASLSAIKGGSPPQPRTEEETPCTPPPSGWRREGEQSSSGGSIDELVRRLTRRLDVLQEEARQHDGVVGELRLQLGAHSELAAQVAEYQRRIQELEEERTNAHQHQASHRAEQELHYARRIGVLETLLRSEQDEKVLQKSLIRNAAIDLLSAYNSQNRAAYKKSASAIAHLLDIPPSTQPTSMTEDKENRYNAFNKVQPLSPMNR